MNFLDIAGLTRFKQKLDTVFAAITHTHSNATQNNAGFLSATDKVKLDGIATGATANTGTITGITMNGASVGTSGVVDLGTVITQHQDITGKLDTALKGAANGLAELDADGKVPAGQLPGYVDNVIEGYYYNNKFYEDSSHTIEITPQSGKVYVDVDTNVTYRWGGTVYVVIASDLALGETSSTAYRGDRGKIAYDHAAAKGLQYPMGFYKILTNSEGHVAGASAVSLNDLTNLGVAAASELTPLSRQFWNSTQEISLTLSTDNKTRIIWCSGTTSGTTGALLDQTYGAIIFVSNGKYAIIHKGTGITIDEESNVLTISSETNIAMANVEL